MDKQPTLGKLLDGPADRDAIHVAIAPVVATEELMPGQHVGFTENLDRTLVGRCEDCVGIIDPFLLSPVRPGERCYLFLYQNTVTGMRHQWEHPAFEPVGDAAESRKWIKHFAEEELRQTYDRLLSAADDWAEYRTYTYDNSETYKDVSDERWEEFWKHWETVTGRKMPEGEPWDRHFFTCSC